ELNARANRLAHCLIDRGVTPDSLVGLCLERSLDMLVALVAILKAGGAYVPLAAELPAARRETLIAGSRLNYILTVESYRGLFSNEQLRVITLDGDAAETAAHASANPGLSLHSGSAAYVNYTSGSTGLPKGVLVPHAAVVRLVRDPNYAHL